MRFVLACVAFAGVLAVGAGLPDGARAAEAAEGGPARTGGAGSASTALGAEAVEEVLADLGGSDADAARAALRRVVEARDRRFVPVLVELLRASGVGLAAPAARAGAARALESLTGERFGDDWPAWMRWLADREIPLPPGFLDWKGRLLAGIDPRFGEILASDRPSRLRPEEIVWGGVGYEGIPALDDPRTIPAAQATYLHPDEPVFGVALGGEARAYPLRILDWHELANDVVGGVPIALAYCTLCGSGIVYEARTEGEGRLRFGSSGLLLRSNKLMVDRETRTLWNQLTGRAVLGPLAAEPRSLAMKPSVVTRWADWRARHPETRVLALDTGHDRPYQPGAAYAGYFASETTMFPVRRARRELAEKARVFGLARGGAARAWPLDALLAARVVNDAVAGEPVVLVAEGPAIAVEGVSVRSGPARYEAGAAVRAYRREGHRFAPAPPDAPSAAGSALVDARGRRWRVEEEALVGQDGARLARVPGVLAYWFGWSAFHPRTELWSAPGRELREAGTEPARGSDEDPREERP